MDPTELLSTCVESGLRAQSQTLQLAQTISQDAIDASGRARASIESISQANREVVDATLSVCAVLGGLNPFLAPFASNGSGSSAEADAAGATAVDEE